jgi:hypothetical protein
MRAEFADPDLGFDLSRKSTYGAIKMAGQLLWTKSIFVEINGLTS